MWSRIGPGVGFREHAVQRGAMYAAVTALVLLVVGMSVWTWVG